ncbi:endoribonuclease ZC3H12A-like isoform X1 [Schistocerca gregaria]|uniref:endoribonuclease ZC3H12A-like isoform X1 n=1 Tax=Schistocerca gregaria TaxID=7010 RepID=UPI00211F293C|nr:endoribonuclease ZC3H12A-like isoform X1 [Schistocerca gregaria]
MDELGQHPCIRVKRKYVRTIYQYSDKIHELFAVRLCERNQKKQDVSKTGGWVLLGIEPSKGGEHPVLKETAAKVQSYVDSVCGVASGESCDDSSYDSDFEAEEGPAVGAPPQAQPTSAGGAGHGQHHDVSRTVSDTLGAEFAEYVSCEQPAAAQAQHDPGYTARVEFGVKLGYSERLVQAALLKLGPAPAQNELLAELVRLGAQHQHQQQQLRQDPVLALAAEDAGLAVACPGAAVCGGAGAAGAADPADDLPLPLPATTAPAAQPQVPLRPIVIDGSNVAMSHGNKEVFSCRGIKICVDWFRARGHKDITVFVPKWRKEAARPDNPVTDQEILTELERDRCLVFTPSRLVGGKRLICYDDRYILKLASAVDGIVVSNDNYRDLVQESPEYRKVVAERILMYSFVNDRFMPPDDPLGRSGPTLDAFLRMQQRGDPPPPCPYGKKCTYGNKCKFHHPERGPLPHKSVTERLVENAQRQLQARGMESRDCSPGTQLKGKSVSLPLPEHSDALAAQPRKIPLARTKSTAPTPIVPVSLTEQSPKSGNGCSVPKSRSVENVAAQQHQTPEVGYATYQQMSGPPPTPYGTWGNTWSTHGQQFPAPPQRLAPEPAESPPPAQEAVGSGVNLHRKLQRQLTLNPAYDARLFQLRGHAYGSGSSAPSSQAPQQHRPLAARHSAGGGVQPQSSQSPSPSWHQSVTRIASAPDTCRHWNTPVPPPSGPGPRHVHRLSSTSDPQLNLSDAPLPVPSNLPVWLPPTPVPSVVWPPPQHMPPPHQQFSSSGTEDARRRLHYHLASIFPEEQVQKAMQLYPDETNPQKICAAILSMFPKP